MDLPFGEYYKQKAGKFGLHAKCKACSRKYDASRRGKVAARYRERCEADGEGVRARMREYYYANRDSIAAQRREYYAANRDDAIARSLEWGRANPHKRRDYGQRRRARMRGSTVARFSQESLLDRMAYFGNKCYMCGGPFEHIDHVKPLSKGGPHMLSNLRPACRSCNCSKGQKWPNCEIV